MRLQENRALLVVLPVLLWGCLSGFYLKDLSAQPIWFWVHDIVGWLVIPLITLVVLGKQFGITPRQYGLTSLRHQQPNVQSVLKILVVIVGFLTFVPAQLGAALVLPTVGDTFSYRDVVPRGRFGTFAVLYLALSAALVEEVFYRGVLARLVIGSRDTALKRHLFVAVSAILFGVNHWSQGLPQVVATIYLGVVAAFLYLRLRNLWYVIGGHLVLNLLTMR